MGWKAIKDAYGIERHIVCVGDKGICIGSAVVHDLVVIDPSTGVLAENRTFSGFLRRNYPGLAAASPEQLLSLIQQDDTFSSSIPVYTYHDGEIVEKRCEVAGWPNVTHDGDLMYENTYSTDRGVVIGWAKRNARQAVRHMTEYIAHLEQKLTEAGSELARVQGYAAKLDADYPNPIAAAT